VEKPHYSLLLPANQAKERLQQKQEQEQGKQEDCSQEQHGKMPEERLFLHCNANVLFYTWAKLLLLLVVFSLIIRSSSSRTPISKKNSAEQKQLTPIYFSISQPFSGSNFQVVLQVKKLLLLVVFPLKIR
jgi:hypothetical protein